MKGKKNVLISVNTLQSFGEETEEIELVTEGTITKKEDSYVIEYEESEISGMEGTKTTLKICDNSVSLVREGSITSNLVFENGKEHVSLYGSEYGAFEVVVRTRKVNIKLQEGIGEVELEYIIETQGLNVSDNRLLLTVKEFA